jgi:hypothetical protein
MQESPEIDSQPAPQGKETTCKVCSLPIQALRSSKKYCSVDCRKVGAWLEKEPIENLIVCIGQKITSKSINKSDLFKRKVFSLLKRWISEAEALTEEGARGELL